MVPSGTGCFCSILTGAVTGGIAVGQAGDDDVLHRRLGQGLLGHGEEHVQPDVGLHLGVDTLEDQLPLGQERADGHEHRPRLQQPVVGDGELGAVGQVYAHLVPLLHPHVGQGGGEAVGELVQLRVGHLHAPEDDGVAPRPLQGRRAQHLEYGDLRIAEVLETPPAANTYSSSPCSDPLFSVVTKTPSSQHTEPIDYSRNSYMKIPTTTRGETQGWAFYAQRLTMALAWLGQTLTHWPQPWQSSTRTLPRRASSPRRRTPPRRSRSPRTCPGPRWSGRRRG